MHHVLAQESAPTGATEGDASHHGQDAVAEPLRCEHNDDADLDMPLSQPVPMSMLQVKRAARHGAEIYLPMIKPAEPSVPTEPAQQPTTNADRSQDGRQAGDLDVSKILADYADVFAPLPPGLPPERAVTHNIDLYPGSKPVCKPIYRMSEAEPQELKQQLASMLDAGFIRPSTSPYGSPVLLVKKKGGTFRLVVDYRLLNLQTIKNAYPLPRIDDLLDRLHDAKYMTAIDLAQGYHQVRVAEQDIYKTAFRTRFGSYEYLVMPFGLCNAPATFQRLMNDIFSDMLGEQVLVYLDDTLVWAPTPEEHDRRLRRVLDRLRARQAVR